MAALGVAVWIVAVGSGMFMVSSFGNTPGPLVTAPKVWPDTSSLAHDSGRATILLFAHARCPCTAASLEQLKQILAKTENPVRCHVVFLIPPQVHTEWKSTSNVRLAKAIPDVTVSLDPGEETRRFAATTSGDVLFYDASGQLKFNGGITISRGHLGDNSGMQALLQLVNRPSAPAFQCPTFGCPLFNDTSICRESASCQN